ncbi:hypothetical protein [Clostridium sp.]|uniref:homing endonuclease associated repeat-containing protein n=1 Tax=Clostridium sp. TaxID=1506 RepID=UPI001B4C111B|nr:hypothetical protein [Clostridium sp.]MBP3916033.1 hypothetical protein [Clostridium sp.]
MKKLYTEEDLLNIIKLKTKELGRLPKCNELKQSASILRTFGSWHKAIELCGFEPNVRYKQSKEEFIKIIRNKATELGRTPRYKDLKERKAIVSKFGTWNNALIESGLDIIKVRSYTKEELLTSVTKISELLKRTPTTEDCPTLARSALTHFGGWNNLLMEAGMKINSYNTKIEYSDDELLDMYIELSNKLGRFATTREIKKHFGFDSVVYSSRFETLTNVKYKVLNNSKLNIEDCNILNRRAKYSMKDINDAIRVLQEQNNIKPFKTRKELILFIRENSLPSLAELTNRKTLKSYKEIFELNT